uniref:Uncharacterized protein n=1 Tax=Helianthus annuus TaxID=4232 RepID=A0A251UQC4_HELAN
MYLIHATVIATVSWRAKSEFTDLIRILGRQLGRYVFDTCNCDCTMADSGQTSPLQHI